MTERVTLPNRYRETDKAESPLRKESVKTTPEPRAMSTAVPPR